MPAAKKAAKKSAARPARKPRPPPAEEPEWAPVPETTPPAASPAAPGWQPAPALPAPTAMDDRTYALLLHLSSLSWLLSIPGFIGPLVMWLVRKERSPFVDAHGRSALNFQISLFVYAVAAMVLFMVVAVATLGLGALLLVPLYILAGLVAMVLVVLLPVLAGVKANAGQPYDYPLAIRFIRAPTPPPGFAAP